MNARFLPLLLAGLTTAALAGCDPSPAPPAADAHAGHDHGEGGSDADHAAHAGHDHGEGGAAGGHHSDHGTSSNASNPTTTPAETSR